MRRSTRDARGWPAPLRSLATLLVAAAMIAPGPAAAQEAKAPGLDESTTHATPLTRAAPAGGESAAPADDRTFRPTVLIRRGSSQGSGTVIASTAAETLVLTAAHVIRAEGPILVELHRYNLGLERADGGTWPLIVPASVAAVDVSGDVALLQLRKTPPLPYVARLYQADVEDLGRDTLVTSLGVDLGNRLTSWRTKIVDTAKLQIREGASAKPFLITLKTPEHGRSGGGLYDSQDRLVGVCVGHAEMIEGRRMGVFASIESIRRLLKDRDRAPVRREARRKAPAAGLEARAARGRSAS